MNTQQNSFKFHIPVDLIEKGKGSEKKLMLRGIASTDDYDRQGEILKNQGFDLEFFKSYGHLNFHHKHDPANIIGFPTKAEINEDGKMYSEFELYDTPTAKAAYTLTKAINKSGKRKMGFSIEGKVLERDPINKSIVTKAKITGCALTHLPVNANTFADVAKAFTGDDDVLTPIDEITKSEAVGGEVVIFEGLTKSGAPMKVMGNGDIVIKTMDTEAVAPLRPESVEGGLKPKQHPPVEQNANGGKVTLTKSEIYTRMFNMNPDLTPDDAIRAMGILMKGMSEAEN